VHIRQGVPPGFPDNNLIVLLVPLEDGAGPDPEFLTNFGGHGNLALGGKFGMCERHNCYITMVMRQSQRDTRLAVDFIVGLLGQGWTQADILRNYPGVTHDDIAACLQYASETLQAEKVYPLTPASAG